MLFVPRQVALAASSSSQARAASTSASAMAKEESKKDKKSKSKAAKGAAPTIDVAAAPGARAAVVASVAAFLESAGLPRTLAALQSEAGLEAGTWASSQVNLEELVDRFLESSNSTSAAATVGSNEQGKENGDIAEGGGKKKKKSGAEAGAPESKASELSTKEKPSENAGGEVKEKKQKKKKEKEKEKDDSSAVIAASGEANETVKNDDHKLGGKKKKSKTQGKEEDVETRLEKAELAIIDKLEAAQELNGEGNKSREEEPKSQNDDAENKGGAVEKKMKKKKKEKLAVESSEKADAGTAPAESNGAKGKNGAVETEKKAKKKRKKSDPEEDAEVEGKEAAGEDSVPKPEAENKCGMEVEEDDNGKPSNENAVAGKKRKLEEVNGSNPPATVKEDNAANQSLSNGFAEDKSNEDSNIKPSKRQKQSERKSVTPFTRVKLDSIKFADERLQDNSYWAKGGAETGYGAKAQEILGQVRGRGFRHEKTKKKRGTYRGGQIDLNTHSIKFDNSDDE